MGKIELFPITGEKVRTYLNRHGASVANIASAYFSGAANIADSSKHKPVRLKAVACQDFDASAPNYYPDWWKAEDKFCGYDITKATANDMTELRDCYNGADNGWVYDRPTGGEYPLRLGDFGGYSADARPLSYGFLVPQTVYKSQTSSTIAINLPSQNEESLSWSDFDTLQDHYFGVLIYSSVGSIRVTATETIGNGGSLITFNPSLLTAGRTYTVYPFISSVPYTEGESDKVMTLYTLPNVEPQLITCKQSAVQIFPAAGKINATEEIEWSVQVRNESPDAITFANNSLRIYKDNGQAMVGDYNIEIPTVTVAAFTIEVIASGVATVGYIDRDFDFATTPLFIEVSLGRGQYFATGMVAEDLSGGGGIT